MGRSLSVSNMDALVGTPDVAALHASRHRIDTGDVQAALEMRRRGRGWQTIANVLRVNATSLRIECGDLPRPEREAVAAPRAAPRDYRRLRAGTQLAAALVALAAGSRTAADLIGVIGLTEHYSRIGANERCSQIMRELIDRGFITPGWALTPQGEAETARLEASADA